MGTLTYDGTLKVDFDDRTLLHLQLVISAKLRRDESFMFTWTTAENGGERTSVWIDRRLPLAFVYSSSEMASVNRRWIDELMDSTFKAMGLQVTPEPARPAEKAGSEKPGSEKAPPKKSSSQKVSA